MTPRTHYELLGIDPAAPVSEVKRAFRAQIARYHPDKVQHLGPEFQAMAVDRATELTEAYRVLSDAGRRAEYDQALAAVTLGPPPIAAGPGAAPPDPTAPTPEPDSPVPHQFRREHASRDLFVRRATIERVRQALAALDGYEESDVRGFDLSFARKPRLFTRNTGPRLLARFVGTVDPDAVAEAWAQVGGLNVPSGESVCVFLVGTELSSPRDLAGAIAEQRRRPSRGARPVLVPTDARTWDAHLPVDAPPVAKELLARLKTSR